MTERRRFIRAAWLLYAALQLLAPGVASIGDATLEARSIASHPVAHVEEHGSPHCARVHPEDCALCRVLSTTATTPAAPAPVAVTRLAPVLPTGVTASTATAGRDVTRSRAPPVAA